MLEKAQDGFFCRGHTHNYNTIFLVKYCSGNTVECHEPLVLTSNHNITVINTRSDDTNTELK